jgi:lysophospholipase
MVEESVTVTAAVTADSDIRRTSLPPGAVVEMRAMDDGWPVRAVRWPGRGPAILFAGGRADFVEKYSEAIWHWVADEGRAVTAFDWRGQGLSGRLGVDRFHGHVRGFDRWVDDLDALARWFAETQPGPHVIVAHSMGGHLALRHLGRGQSPLSGAVLLAPMVGIRGTSPLVGTLARLVVALGFGGRFGLGQRPYGERQRSLSRSGLLTGSPQRFAAEHEWIDRMPDLALGGVTWGWLAAAYRSIAALDAPGVLESVAVPVLTLMGGDERLVDPEAAERATRRMPHATFETVAGGHHELLRDADDVMADALGRVTGFVDTLVLRLRSA